MIENIKSQLDIIENSINWIKDTDSMRGAKGDNLYRNLVDYRRKLKKKHFALEGNPSVAIFGQSQVGKSYLIDALLSDQHNAFNIIDSNNVEYNFKKDINPQGGGSESTSLVSRFSASYQPIHPKFPIKAKLLSPADLILVLCDSYHNDIKVSRDTMIRIDEIDSLIVKLNSKYKEQEDIQFFLSEDDIVDIKEYVFDNLSSIAANIPSTYFDGLSIIISKINPDEWKDVFSVLWNRNVHFTDLFSKLIQWHKTIYFSDTLYLPVESILYKHGTLLDIMRIKEIYEEPRQIEIEYKGKTELLVLNIEGEETIVAFPKSYLCALTAEVIFNIPHPFTESKPFLNHTDLLDFPGARARKTTPENEIAVNSMNEFYIRGKVAYLFNKFANAEKLNILLLCAKHEQPTERAMPELIAPLINKIVGDTPELREEFIKKSKISPLFIVGTFFNVNLEFNLAKDNNQDDSSLRYRWNQRFDRSLADELIDVKTYQWFRNWTVSTPNFNNIFLLRDFEHSTQIFDGYNSINHQELSKCPDPESYPNFSQKLRQSFLDYDFVKNHFEDPEESWDRAASVNEDGTGLIIEKLSIAASNIGPARTEKNIRELNDISGQLKDELDKYYHDSDSDKLLQKAKVVGGKIQAKLDIAFGQNPYFFGSLMDELILSQSTVYDLYHKIINDLERKDIVDLSKYSAIRMNVSKLSSNKSFDENLECLKEHYEHESIEECKDHFDSEGIDLNELFYGNNDRVKSFSRVLAESLETFWFDEYMNQNRSNLSKIFSEAGLEDIQDMLRRLYKKLRITNIIEDKIKRHVDGYNNIEEVYEMIADISAETINKFITSIGLDFLSDSELEDLKSANDKSSLGLSLDNDELIFQENTHEEVAELVSSMDNLSELLNQNPLPAQAKRLPNYRNYIIWYNLLKAGFIYVCDIPNYSVQANNELKLIIDELSSIKY